MQHCCRLYESGVSPSQCMQRRSGGLFVNPVPHGLASSHLAWYSGSLATFGGSRKQLEAVCWLGLEAHQEAPLASALSPNAVQAPMYSQYLLYGEKEQDARKNCNIDSELEQFRMVCALWSFNPWDGKAFRSWCICNWTRFVASKIFGKEVGSFGCRDLAHLGKCQQQQPCQNQAWPVFPWWFGILDKPCWQQVWLWTNSLLSHQQSWRWCGCDECAAFEEVVWNFCWMGGQKEPCGCSLARIAGCSDFCQRQAKDHNFDPMEL